MLLIYTNTPTNRFYYITGVLFTSVWPVAYSVTTDVDAFISYDGPKINYSPGSITTSELWIQPHALLLDKGISPQKVECFNWLGATVFFKTGGHIPFDVFAASFYLITRYEEYLPHQKDEYGRYAHQNSTAYKNGFLHLPLVNIWMKEIFSAKSFPTAQVAFNEEQPPFSAQSKQSFFLPTYDIDIAFAYKGKGLLRNVGGFYKEVFTGQWKQAAERANVHSGWKSDPFDTYNWLDTLHKKYCLHPVYFFLLAERNRLYDKNILPHTAVMGRLVKTIAAKYTTGIHPSWQSGDDEALLQKEISTLQGFTGTMVTLSRQHYIRMALPHTYRLLIANGIEEDYSMGYGSINGFRASVASPFHWYDVEQDTQTNLLVNPYCFMEANSFFEQHYSAAQAATELQQYHDVLKSTGGRLITIFHNHFVTEQPQWIDWRNMYATFLEKNF